MSEKMANPTRLMILKPFPAFQDDMKRVCGEAFKVSALKQKRQHGEQWRMLAVEAAGIGIWEYDPVAAFFSASEKTFDLFGCKFTDARMGFTQLWRRIHPVDREPVRHILQHLLKSCEDPVFQIQFRILHPARGTIWLMSRGRTTYSETADGPYPLQVHGVVLEVTKQKHAEQAMQKRNRELELRIFERTAEAQRQQTQLHRLARELSRSEELERQRIASVLHDDLQQVLAALRLRIDRFADASSQSGHSETDLESILQLIDQSIRMARSLSHELYPPVLNRQGLLAALKWLCRDMQSKFGLHVSLDTHPQANPRSSVLTSVLYRSVSELLFNCRKHAGTNEVFISAHRQDSRLVICVRDQGRGTDSFKLRRDLVSCGGRGLATIEDRIRLLGGEVAIESKPGKGFCVTICVPDCIPD